MLAAFFSRGVARISSSRDFAGQGSTTISPSLGRVSLGTRPANNGAPDHLGARADCSGVQHPWPQRRPFPLWRDFARGPFYLIMSWNRM